MEPSEKARLIEVCEMVAKDTKRDVEYYEGKPFTGRNVAEFNGKQAACIKALADILKRVIEDGIL